MSGGHHAVKLLIDEDLSPKVAQALRETFAGLLRVRFGDLDHRLERRIANASPEDLARWIERVVTAERLDDTFEP